MTTASSTDHGQLYFEVHLLCEVPFPGDGFTRADDGRGKFREEQGRGSGLDRLLERVITVVETDTNDLGGS